MQFNKLEDLEVNEISLVDRAANKRRFLFFKAKEGKRMDRDELEKEMQEEEAVSEDIEKAIDEKKLKGAAEALLEALSGIELPKKASGALKKLVELLGLEYGYGYGYPEPKEKAKTEKSFIEKLKALIFQHEQEGLRKARDNFEVAFAAAQKITDISEATWQLRDVIQSILSDSEGDKSERIKANIDAYAKFVLDVLERDGVEKALEAMEKAGRKISTARLAKLKETHASLVSLANALAELIQEAEGTTDGEGGLFQVTKEEFEKAVGDVTAKLEEAIKKSLEPVEERISKLEKAHEEAKKALEESIQKAVEPLSQRVETIEKARGVSQSIPTGGGQDKPKGVFTGVIFGKR